MNIPIEFQPQNQSTSDDGQFDLLFREEEKEESPCHDNEVKVGPYSYHLKCPPDLGTLFAHQIWSGSIFLAEYILQNPHLVLGKKVIEFGSGTALPSLVALTLNSSLCMITDYPEIELLSSLRETVGLNWDVIHKDISCDIEQRNRVEVTGYKWGDNASNVLQQQQFDIALLSECLWMHREHSSLAKSLNDTLCPGGVAFLTYAHHVPGCEENDVNFFKICKREYGLDVCEELTTRDMPYMWDKEKTVTIYLGTVKKPL